MNLIDRPLDYMGARRTSLDAARDGCAIHTFKRRMPASEKALYWVGAMGAFASLLACIFD